MADPQATSGPPPAGNATYAPFPETFCREALWDRAYTWDTDNPQFTPCFQKTVLVWIPCVFLWLMLPFQSYRILSSHFKIRRWTWLSIAKTTFSLLLFVLAVMDMSYVAHQWNTVEGRGLPDVDLIAPLIKAATFLLSVFFIYTDKRSARPSSAILFLFWLLILVESVVLFQERIRHAQQNGIHHHFLFVTTMLYFPITLAQFVLSCWAEYFPEREHGGLIPCPELFASFPNRLAFGWFTGLARLGWKRPLVQADLWDINPGDRTQVSTNKLEKYWRHEMVEFTGPRHKEPSLLLALAKTFWLPVLLSGILKLGNDIFVFVAPQILQLLIGFTTDKNAHSWKGYFYAVVLLFASFGQTIILAQYFHMSMRIGMHIRSAVIATVYRKALRITSAAKRSSTVGEIVNLMSVDSQRFMDLMAFLHLLWSSPLQMALAIYFLYNQLGPSVFAGLGVMILMVPINAVIASKTRALQIAQMKEKDGRIKLITEILNGMKVLKLYAWEESFLKQILGIRDHELETLKKAAYLSAFSSFTWILSPFLVALVSFATYVLVDEKNVLDSQKAFVSLSLFNILRFPLSMLPMVITSVVQAKVSVERLTKFLKNEELDPENVKMIPADDNSNSAVTVTQGSFSWGKDDPIVLRDINLDVKQGKLIAVVGQVGSGKSSLIAAMLGLMERRSGNVTLKGSISYVSQQAWIQNLTLKENILFGKPLDEARYKRVIEACALAPDLEMLPGGDQTEIGEKGINLSGGQKQRVSLARAVYSGADVCFLDDPLSAVDAHVGKHLFENVLGPKGLLAGKTRILVTHGISFLPQTDLVVVIDEGTISEVGTYQELLQKKGAFAEVLRTYLQEEIEAEDDPDAIAIKQQVLQEIGDQPPDHARAQRTASITSQTSNSSLRKIKQQLSRVSRQDSKKSNLSPRKSMSPEKEPEKNGGPAAKAGAGGPRAGLVGAETSETGSVKWNVYMMYLKHMTYGASFVIILFYAAFNGVAVGTNVWLGEWSNDSYIPERRNSTEWRDYRLGIYGALGAIQGIFVFMSALVLAYGQIRASRNLHQNMLVRILHAPMAFFDTTPLGRIVNRFSKDVDTVDTMLPMNIRMWLNCVFSVLSTVVVIIYSVPLFATVILPLGIFYYFVQRFYIATSRQLKRLESVSRSPIYSHFQESVTGTMVIVATKQTERFIHDNENRVDTNNASYYPNIASQRWLAVRLESVGNLIVFFAAFFAVITRDWKDADGKHWVDPKDMGLAVSYAMTVTQTLNWMVRMTSELETNVVSVERIKEYTEIPMEADWIIDGKRPPQNWPQTGAIDFNDYQTRYRPGLDLVLRGVKANIQPREKIGIVGRTGAGKSSLTLALFRIIEPAGGSIVIDGIDIFTMGLHDVRSHLTIIPQEPVLFSGTLRLNLDPFNAYSDEDVWMALENSHLKRFVSSLPDGLQHAVAEGGENLSVGQRQLICLARALLRKTKILVLDEATAAVDLETDDLIQRTIRDKFADCTILTIAHRLNTIMDSTRIMVLDQGKIKELDSPENLLRDRNTIFYGLAKDANLA
ncbi:multidrug resistance-associated protein 1-like [Paramacrobiotus metropolitanus]|uniref:multidrug resistance-associated protein 1-like n=1 Tax=Paramacrobiotus metropolitanus TaxID=2943436 RepID=UPI002445A8E5|nr:multidrug resistance-associated protein 1-like [Paramacrobiotus metropolitanus]